MIRISKIDDKLSIYKNNKVIVWGAGAIGKQLCEMLIYFGIMPIAVCDNDAAKWGGELAEIPIVSPDTLWKMKETVHVVVQLAMQNHNFELEVIKQLKENGLHVFITTDEANVRLKGLKNSQLIRKNKDYAEKVMRRFEYSVFVAKYFAEIYFDEQIFGDEFLCLCLPQKTGDFTIQRVLDDGAVKYYNYWHQPQAFRRLFFVNADIKVKMITAVREPISQNISALYQAFRDLVSGGLLLRDDVMWKAGGDAQLGMDVWLQMLQYETREDGYKENEVEKALLFRGGSFGRLIQQFIPEFQEHVIDIMKYPFDVQKGYSIMREGNVEVFVYQVERLSEIYKELFDWANVDVNVLTNENVMSDTWLADSYKQAQNEIEFSQGYFDKCYEEPYVKHFYSEEDIVKFKNKWKSHIKIKEDVAR